MSTVEIRQKLHEFIDTIEEKKVKAIYTLFEDQIIGEEEFELSDDQVALINEERDKHLNGESKSYRWEEAKMFIKGDKNI